MQATTVTKVSWFALSLAILVGLLGCRSTSVEEVEVWINKEVPVGSTKTGVLSALEKKGIKHSADYKPEQYYERTKKINAKVPDSSSGVLVTGDIFIIFQFSEEDVLERYTVEEIVTGL